MTTLVGFNVPILLARPPALFGYDQNGNQNVNRTIYRDEDNNVVNKSTESTFDEEGRVTETAYYEWDHTGFRPDSLQPFWTTSTVYNSVGQVESTTDRFGNTTTNIYDIVGNLIETRTPVNDPAHASSDLVLVSRTVFDKNGRSIAVSDPFLMELVEEDLSMVTHSDDLRVTRTKNMTIRDGSYSLSD